MSVINQVLKDLDERQPLASEQEKYSINAVDDKQPSTDYIRMIVWVVAALLIIGAVAYYLWLENQVPDEQAFQPVNASVAPGVTPVVAKQKHQVANVTEANNKPKDTLPPQPVEQQAVEQQMASQEVAAPEAVSLEPVRPAVIVNKPVQEPETKPYLPLRDDGKPVEMNAPVVKLKPDQGPKAEIIVVKTKKAGLELAREMLVGGRLTEAEKLLKALIKEKPASLPARELLAGLLLRNNRTDEAAAEIATARKYYPRSDNLVLLQAKMMLSRGEQQQVTHLLQQHVQVTKASEKPRALLASLYQRSGNYADAYRLYNQLAKHQSANEEYWMGLAISLDGLQQPGKARQAYSRALQSSGLSPALREYAIKRIHNIDLQGNNNE